MIILEFAIQDIIQKYGIKKWNGKEDIKLNKKIALK